jgi:hypothetical protein
MSYCIPTVAAPFPFALYCGAYTVGAHSFGSLSPSEKDLITANPAFQLTFTPRRIELIPIYAMMLIQIRPRSCTHCKKSPVEEQRSLQKRDS